MNPLIYSVLSEHPTWFSRLETQGRFGFSLWNLSANQLVWLSPGLEERLSTESGEGKRLPVIEGGYSAKDLRLLAGGPGAAPFSLGFRLENGKVLWVPTFALPFSKNSPREDEWLLLEHEFPRNAEDLTVQIQQLQKLFSLPDQTLLLLDYDQKVLYYGENGLDPELHPESRLWLGQPFAAVNWATERKTAIEAAMEEVRLTDSTCVRELTEHHTGSRIHFTLMVSLFRDSRMHPELWVIRLRNITPQKNALEQVRHLEALLQNLHEISFIVNPQGWITWANEAFQHRTGCGDAQPNPLHLFSLFGPEMGRQARETIEETLRNCRQSTFEISRLSGENPHFHLEIHVQPIFNDVGHCTHLVCSGREVSRERQSQAHLETLHRLLKETNRVAGVGGWSFETHSDRVFWSPEVYAIHEVEDDFIPTVEEVVRFYEGEAQMRYFEAGRDAIQSGIPYDLILPIRTGKGNQVYVRVQGIPEFEEDHCVRLYGSIRRIEDPSFPMQ